MLALPQYPAFRPATNARPSGPFRINRASWQAQGLLYWVACTCDGHLRDMSYQRVTSFESTATPIYSAFRLGGLGVGFGGNGLQLQNFTPPSLITVVAWVHAPDGGPNNEWRAIVEGNRSANGAYGLWKSGNGSFWHWRWSSSSSSDFGTEVNGADTMLVGVFDGTNARAYQDGVSKLTTASSRAAPVSGTTTFGKSGAGEPFNNGGLIAEVRLYNYGWTDAQVGAAYNNRWELALVPDLVTELALPDTSPYLLVKN